MAITRWTYRFVVVGIVLLSVASGWVQSVEEHSLPEPLRHYTESQASDWDRGGPRVVVSIAVAIAGLLGLAGLLQFMAWSRPILVAVQIAWLGVTAWSGPVVQPPITSMLDQAANLAMGAVLVMSFLPPVSGWFRPGLLPSEDESPVRGLFVLGVFAG